MHKRLVVAGVGLLGVAAALAIASYGVPTPLKTGSLYPNEDPQYVGCYTSGVSGELLDDLGAGTAIVDSMDGRRVLVTWPIGWTARRSLLGVSVVDSRGQFVARTGTYVNLSGGYWYVDNSFLTCGAY